MTSAIPRPLTDVSDAGLIAAIEADQIATRILAPEVPVEDGEPNPAAAHHKALLEAIPPTLAGEPVPPRYLGRIDGRPVATSRIAIAAGVAGLYAVATLPEWRGRGIGRAMTVAALQAGHSIGLRIGVLQASDSGLPVYRRLGFRTICEYEVYLRPR